MASFILLHDAKKIKEKIQNNMKTVDEASNMPADCYGKD